MALLYGFAGSVYPRLAQGSRGNRLEYFCQTKIEHFFGYNSLNNETNAA